ncbi:SURF1 family protein [Kitasatospora sp. NBC_01250]|uniref:SURF1 family protein n=1 Tax=unclassified Kitasatospora TaxID=2633591 RepID=UPI002E12C599|nr:MULTISPECIES: SURF1 family protein [unclassified Kitasatospora]WSJ68057.1 SURF1 family protein [Kitasatospora sp. NBC_01302]
MYRFLLTPRWLGSTVLAVAAIAVCLWLGSWQLSRFEGRVSSQHTASTSARPAAPQPAASPLDSVLSGPDAQVGTGTLGHPVSASGQYDSAHQLLVPNRTVDNRQGYYVLTPLRTATGRAVPVVRGWLPGSPGAGAAVPAPPSGEVTVTGRLQASESADTSGAVDGGLPAGQLGMISPATLVNLLPYPVYDGWVAADDVPSGLTAVPTAQVSGGGGLDARAFQNLGYTLQWFVFAGFVGFMWFRLARRQAEAVQDRALGLEPVLD